MTMEAKQIMQQYYKKLQDYNRPVKTEEYTMKKFMCMIKAQLTEIQESVLIKQNELLKEINDM
jgi:hypothetical protein